MNRYLVGVLLAVALLVGTTIAAFVMQNLNRGVDLSLNLGVAAWQTSQPLPVPWLMALCVAVGAVAGALVVVWSQRSKPAAAYEPADGADW